MKTDKPAKIAVVIPKYGLVGGGEKFVLELSERIARNDAYELHVFANKWKEHSNRIRFHKVPIISFPKYLTTVSFAWFAQREIAKQKIDIVHAHERIFSADIVSLHSIPHSFWIRDIRRKMLPSLFDLATIWVERRMSLNERTIFLPVSGIAAEKFVSEYPNLSSRVEVLHPGVDISKFDSLSRVQCRQKIRSQFGIRETDRLILFVGMNWELKGLDQLIAAIAKIKVQDKNIALKLLVVGKGNERKYRNIARTLGIGADVYFAGVKVGDMEETYLAADIFSMLSSFDTFGMTVLEAMTASLPVIVSHNVGAKDLVRDGANGFIVSREDIDAISNKISFLLNEDTRRCMGLEARETAEAHTWDRLAERVSAYYEEILSKRVA